MSLVNDWWGQTSHWRRYATTKLLCSLACGPAAACHGSRRGCRHLNSRAKTKRSGVKGQVLPVGGTSTQRRASLREVSLTALMRIRRFIATGELPRIMTLGRSYTDLLALAYTHSRRSTPSPSASRDNPLDVRPLIQRRRGHKPLFGHESFHLAHVSPVACRYARHRAGVTLVESSQT